MKLWKIECDFRKSSFEVKCRKAFAKIRMQNTEVCRFVVETYHLNRYSYLKNSKKSLFLAATATINSCYIALCIL